MTPDPSWGEIKPKIQPVRRGTGKRRARAIAMHMETFWAMSKEERQMAYEISKAGRRR